MQAICDAFMNAVTVKTKVSSHALTAAELFEKTVIFLADGASVMGVRSKGKTVSHARAGENFFHYLQSAADEYFSNKDGGQKKKIIGYWCDNHRLDIVASDGESSSVYVQDLLR